MVLDKTGGLFRLAVGLMQALCSGGGEGGEGGAGGAAAEGARDFTPLVDKLALYFQVTMSGRWAGDGRAMGGRWAGNSFRGVKSERDFVMWAAGLKQSGSFPAFLPSVDSDPRRPGEPLQR